MTNHSRRVLCAAAVFAGLASMPVTTHAQKVLISQGTTQLVDLSTLQVEWTLPFGTGLPGAVFTSDGRYAVGVSFDAATPAVRLIDVERGASIDVPVSFEARVAHPRAPAVFGLTGGPLGFGVMARGTLARLDVGGLTTYGGCAAGTTSGVGLSGDGRLLFALCDSGDLVVLDAASGAILRTLNLPGVSFAPNFDGAELLVARYVADGAIDWVDSVTGAVLHTTVVPGASGCRPWIHAASPDRKTALVSCMSPLSLWPSWSTRVLVTTDLSWGAVLGRELNVSDISPDNRMAFSRYRHRLGLFGSLQTHDLATGATTRTAPVDAFMAVSYAPLAPLLDSVVSGCEVRLSWTLPVASPAVTGYVVEVGSAAGRSDLGTIAVGAESVLTVSSVPAGRYYVRLKARNAAGFSAPSAEIVVEVS